MSPAPPAQRDKMSAALSATKQSHLPGAGTCTYDMERDRIGLWGSGDGQSNSRLSGLDRLKHPGLNKVIFPINRLCDILLGHGCIGVRKYRFYCCIICLPTRIGLATHSMSLARCLPIVFTMNVCFELYSCEFTWIHSQVSTNLIGLCFEFKHLFI